MRITAGSSRFQIKHVRYGLAGAFFLIALTALLPVMAEADGSGIFGWDLIEWFQDLNDPQKLDLPESLRQMTDYGTEKVVRFFLGTWILTFMLPLIEGALALLLPGEACLLSSGLGLLVNLTLRLIVTGEIRSMADLQLPLMPVLLWAVLHGAAAALIVWYLARKRMENTKREVYRMEDELLIDEPVRKGRETAVADREFYGAIIGLTGMFKGRAYPMMMGETVFVGSSDGDHVKVRTADMEEASLCQISYDEALGEYRVCPTARRSVHLSSGQPLGAHRLYCLPRGTELTIADSGDRFRLA